MTAADRILAMRPSDVRKLSDEDTALLILDLKEIGFTSAGLVEGKTMAEARGFLSSIRVWASILAMAGYSDDAPSKPKPKRERERPAPPAPPATRTERARQTDRKIIVGITATEANEFLASLPPYGETHDR